jgi:Tfp pilus assembly protein PilV
VNRQYGGARDQRGTTLVEILITITIIGIGFVAVLGAIAVFHRSTGTQRGTATNDSAVRTYAEQLQAAPYSDCASAYNGVSAPSGFTPTVVVSYWSGDAAGTYSSNCSGDRGTQRLQVTLTDAGGRADTIYVVKRKP